MGRWQESAFWIAVQHSRPNGCLLCTGKLTLDTRQASDGVGRHARRRAKRGRRPKVHETADFRDAKAQPKPSAEAGKQWARSGQAVGKLGASMTNIWQAAALQGRSAWVFGKFSGKQRPGVSPYIILNGRNGRPRSGFRARGAYGTRAP